MSTLLIRNPSKKRKRRKSKKKRCIVDVPAYRLVVTGTQCPWLPNRRPWKTPSRNQSVVNRSELIKDTLELNAIAQDLKRRIAAIPLRNRPVPTTVDPYVLGIELKLRLAAKTPLLEERTDRNRRVWVQRSSVSQRIVPVYHIDNNYDSVVDCQMRVNRRNGNIKRISER